MFNKGLNPQKLKIKHILGCQREPAGFPDSSDILFFMVEQCNNTERETYQFSDEVIAKRFEITQERARTLLDSLVQDETLSYVKDTNKKRVYEMKENPLF